MAATESYLYESQKNSRNSSFCYGTTSGTKSSGILLVLVLTTDILGQ